MKQSVLASLSILALAACTPQPSPQALKKYTMPFDPGPDGSFGQTHMDEGGSVVHYDGRIIGDVMDANVENPPCEYHWHLKKG
jgi:hypothetical protein